MCVLWKKKKKIQTAKQTHFPPHSQAQLKPNIIPIPNLSSPCFCCGSHSLSPNPSAEAASSAVGLDHGHKGFFLPLRVSYGVSSSSPRIPVSLPQHGFLHRPRVFLFGRESLLQRAHLQLRVSLAACLSEHLQSISSTCPPKGISPRVSKHIVITYFLPWGPPVFLKCVWAMVQYGPPPVCSLGAWWGTCMGFRLGCDWMRTAHTTSHTRHPVAHCHGNPAICSQYKPKTSN